MTSALRLLVVVCGVVFRSLAQDGKTAFVTVVAVDDNRQPVTNVEVVLAFEQRDDPDDKVLVHGWTDNRGSFGAARLTSGFVSARLSGPGWYSTFSNFRFMPEQVWTATNEVVVRRIRSPTALYARRLTEHLPGYGVRAGLDLLVGSWCPPHGTGVVADIVFTVVRDLRSEEEVDVKVVMDFPGTGNGISEGPTTSSLWQSDLRVPHVAPEEGYRQSRTNEFGRRAAVGYYGQQDGSKRNFFFRIRGSRGDDGRLVYYYGKVYGDVRITDLLDDRCKIEMWYYINPSGSPNLEFDRKRNLFTNLPRFDRVGWP